MKAAALLAGLLMAVAAAAQTPPSPAELLAASPAGDWREVPAEQLLRLQLPAGPVWIELAPEFAPYHAANLLKLVQAGWFDGLSINRVQDNYVVQWGDPAAGSATARPYPEGVLKLISAELRRSARGLAFTALPDPDSYAAEVGHSAQGLPMARESDTGMAWLAHCYGMVGAGRDEGPDSGNAAELYVVIGHAPRHLDRNVTLLGRVLEGMERLSSLPRGSGALGFYEQPLQRVPVVTLSRALDLKPEQRVRFQVLRPGSPTWSAWTEARRHRRES
ncbi:MAG TPA: peptidylprolyl isomerase, partial [Nevskiaceae bacterium]|nr:peptidylprolyl isomerase [Nevskiaceae bacterium]